MSAKLFVLLALVLLCTIAVDAQYYGGYYGNYYGAYGLGYGRSYYGYGYPYSYGYVGKREAGFAPQQ